MNSKTKLSNILFLDIETVPEVSQFSDLSEKKQEMFAKKTEYQRKEEFTPEEFYERAGIWAEFGKIVCISVGFFDPFSQDKTLRIKSFYGKEESRILTDFKTLLEKYFYQPQHLLCAHNGKEFDFPYIARRMIIKRIPLPERLNRFGRNPWELAHVDT
jgi:DNA polymerase elongation subunit (family B)